MATKTLIPIACLFLLPGCAGEVELQRVAGQSSAILSSYRTQVRDFAAGQDALNAADESRLVTLARMREMRQAEIDARLASWKLGGGDAARRFAIVSEASVDEVLANAGPPPAPVKIPALSYDSSEVDAIIKQLVTLQKPVTIGQRLDDLIAFGSALRDAYGAALDDAKSKAAAATGDAEASAKDEEAAQAAVPQ